MFRVAPAVRVASTKAGARQIVRPVPLNERQRVGRGIRWILEASRGKAGRTLEERLAKEVVAVIKGESGALTQKEQAHKAAMVARCVLCFVNVGFGGGRLIVGVWVDRGSLKVR